MSDKERILMNEEEAELVLGGTLNYDCVRGQTYYSVWSDEDTSKVYNFNPSDKRKISSTIFYECDGMSDQEQLDHLSAKGLIWLAQ